MRPISKILCFAVLLIVVIGSVSPAVAFSDIRCSQYHNMMPEKIQKIVDMAEKPNVKAFTVLEKNPNVLALFGEIPELSNGVEAYEYWIKKNRVVSALANDDVIQSMHYANGGVIIGKGVHRCYISVFVLDEHADEFTKEDMLIVKERVDYYAALEGIENIPLVFYKEEITASFLTIEQVLHLWEAGDDGLRIHTGLEILEALSSSNGSSGSSDSSGISTFVLTSSVENQTLNPTDADNYSLLTAFFRAFRSNNSDDHPSLITRFIAFFRPHNPDLTRTPDLESLSGEKVRPIVGGIMISTTKSSGTVSFAARDVNDSNIRGIVTAAHIFHFEDQIAYQPRQGKNTSVGTLTRMVQECDSVFIQMNASDVSSVIYTGKGDSRLLYVIGFEGAASIGTPVGKSGITSGNTEGTFTGIRYNKAFTVGDGITYTVRSVGVVTERSVEKYSAPGDSGGPVFIETRAVVNGTETDVVVLLGILEGGDGKGTVFFIPVLDIKEGLGVVPLIWGE